MRASAARHAKRRIFMLVGSESGRAGKRIGRAGSNHPNGRAHCSQVTGVSPVRYRSSIVVLAPAVVVAVPWRLFPPGVTTLSVQLPAGR